jgi:hypothetical protein
MIVNIQFVTPPLNGLQAGCSTQFNRAIYPAPTLISTINNKINKVNLEFLIKNCNFNMSKRKISGYPFIPIIKNRVS